MFYLCLLPNPDTRTDRQSKKRQIELVANGGRFLLVASANVAETHLVGWCEASVSKGQPCKSRIMVFDPIFAHMSIASKCSIVTRVVWGSGR